MNGIEKAVEVITGVSVNWEELGRAFGEQYPEDQARFLLGMWEQTSDGDAERIARSNALGATGNSNRVDLAQFLRLLADAIDPAGNEGQR